MTTHEQQMHEQQIPAHSQEEPQTLQAQEARQEVREEAPEGPVTAGQTTAPAPPAPAERESSTEEMLFADDDLAELRSRWAAVQGSFVDDPKDCVQKADVLVSDLVDQLTTGFAHARSRLEEQWARGEDASTEDLRMALMHYREFFERLLTV
jgi:hypothetical protein